MGEELKGFHGVDIGLLIGCIWHRGWLSFAFSGPDPRHPQNSGDQNELKRQPRPGHPGVRGKAVDLHMVHCHVDVRGKDRDEEQGQAPSGPMLDRAHGNQQPNAAEQLEHSADQDAGDRKRNPHRHGRQEKLRVNEVNSPCEKKERDEKQTSEIAADRGEKRRHERDKGATEP